MGVQRAIDYLSFMWQHYNWTMMLNTSEFWTQFNLISPLTLFFLFVTVRRSMHNAQYSKSNLEYSRSFLEAVEKKYPLEDIHNAIQNHEHELKKYRVPLVEQYFELLIDYE